MNLVEKNKILQKIYDTSERCLLAPENPFTLDNPDAITAYGGNLFAVYIPTYIECNNVDSLLRRLFLSQLSYGYKLISVLLIVDEQNICNNVALVNSFNYVAYTFKDLLVILQQANPIERRSEYFSELQTKHYLSYRKNLKLSEIVNNEKKCDSSIVNFMFGDMVEVPSWSTNIIRKNKSFRKLKTGFVAFAEKNNSSSFRAKFDQLMTITFMAKYYLDNGEIYPSNYNSELCVVNTDWSMFVEGIIPNVYNHMLSFIGLPPVSISSEQDFDLVLQIYQNI